MEHFLGGCVPDYGNISNVPAERMWWMNAFITVKSDTAMQPLAKLLWTLVKLLTL